MEDIAKNVEKAVEAALKDAGEGLVDPQRFAQGVKAYTDKYDFSLVDGDKKRSIRVDVRLPSKNEVLQQVVRKLISQGNRPIKEEIPGIVKLATPKLEPYFPRGEAANAWLTRVQHGNTEVIFEGVPHDSDHILNRAYTKIQADSPVTIGMPPSALKRLYPQGNEAQLKSVNKPDNAHNLVAVNDTVLLNFQEADINIPKRFGHTLELVDAHTEINATKGLQLSPYLKIGTVNREVTTFRVNNYHQVTAGTGYFGKGDLPPKGAVKAALLHENHHVLNGDFSSKAMNFMNVLAKALPLKDIATICEGRPNTSAEAFLQAGGGDVDAAKKLIGNMSAHLDDIDAALKPVYRHLRNIPLKGTDGLVITADIEGDDLYQKHIEKVAATEVPLQSVNGFMTLAKHVIEAGKQHPVDNLPKEDIAQVKDAMNAMFADHKELFGGVDTIRATGRILNHASEHRADKGAVKYLENPEDLIAMLRWARGGGFTSASYTHPSDENRYKAIREWAKAEDKPVLGAATAALAKRAATPQQRSI